MLFLIPFLWLSDEKLGGGLWVTLLPPVWSGLPPLGLIITLLHLPVLPFYIFSILITIGFLML